MRDRQTRVQKGKKEKKRKQKSTRQSTALTLTLRRPIPNVHLHLHVPFPVHLPVRISQYLSSQRLIQVNWGALSSRYDNLLSRVAGPSDPASTSGKANTNTNTAQRLWIRTTHFLTADFQPRATFMAGLLLGLRLG